jgi:hypothetical protein
MIAKILDALDVWWSVHDMQIWAALLVLLVIAYLTIRIRRD